MRNKLKKERGEKTLVGKRATQPGIPVAVHMKLISVLKVVSPPLHPLPLCECVCVCVNVCQRLKSAPESPCSGTWDFVDQRQTRSKHWASRLKTNLRSLYSMADMPVCFRSGLNVQMKSMPVHPFFNQSVKSEIATEDLTPLPFKKLRTCIFANPTLMFSVNYKPLSNDTFFITSQMMHCIQDHSFMQMTVHMIICYFHCGKVTI